MINSKLMRRKEMSMEENILPIILLLIVFLNCFPLNFFNAFTKESIGVSTIILAIVFLVQTILMIICLYKKVNFNKSFKIITSILVGITSVLTLIQIYNFIKKDFYIMDLFNIACQFINIFLMIACISGYKTKEKYIIFFMKGIVCLGFIACLFNLYIYRDEIYKLVTLKNIGYVNIKGVFANRNQFAFFLLVYIMATVFLLVKEKKPLYFLIFLPVFILNLFFTMSRTGLICLLIFIGLYLLSTRQIKIRFKAIMIVLGIAVVLIGGLLIYKKNPGTLAMILRMDQIRTLSGRTEIWKRGFSALEGNDLNYIVGVGRFKGITKLVFDDGDSFTQFHNTYIEFLVAGGILELIGMVGIYLFVFYKVSKSNMDKEYKIVYFNMLITFLIYMLTESFGRFAIGASDTICLIFFVSIPLLHANALEVYERKECNKINEEKEV